MYSANQITADNWLYSIPFNLNDEKEIVQGVLGLGQSRSYTNLTYWGLVLGEMTDQTVSYGYQPCDADDCSPSFWSSPIAIASTGGVSQTLEFYWTIPSMLSVF